MTKADKLRAAGKDAGAEGLSAAQIIKIAGHQSNISPMVKTGEFTIKKTDDGNRYIYNTAFTREQRTERDLPIKRHKKKPARKSAKKHTARIRKIAEAIATAPPPVAPRPAATDRRQQTAAHHRRQPGRRPRHQPPADRRDAQRRAGGIAG